MNKNKPTHRKHNPYHDYSSRCIYHITLVVSDRCKVFGHMVDARSGGDGYSVGVKNAPRPDGKSDRRCDGISNGKTDGISDRRKGDGAPYGRKADGTPWTEKELAESAKVELTPLGYEISEAINSIPYEWGKRGVKAQILQKVVMPEHLHFLLFIQEAMAMRLQKLMRGWKQGCNKRLKRYLVDNCSGGGDGGRGVKNASQPNGNSDGQYTLKNASQPNGNSEGQYTQENPQGMLPSSAEVFLRSSNDAGIAPFLMEAINARRNALHDASIGKRLLEEHALFEEDFDETRLRRKGQLQKMIAYVHNNPKHRWLRDNKPQWLLPIRGIEIAGRLYDAIGNVNLLALQRFQDHTRYKWYQANDTEAIRNHKNDCVIHARKNYAIVSPFVHPDEAAVRDYCLKEGHSIIQLCDNGFSDLQQCPGGLYDYCVNGLVLMLVPSGWSHIDRKGKCTRQECNVLNGYAQEIVEEINND